jgi:predicted O-methyltransferase YrrM
MRQRIRDLLAYWRQVLALPPRVASFYVRARRAALRSGDEFSLRSATPARSARQLLAVARGRRRVVEVGTGTGWGAIALALADRKRRVVSYDPIVREERERYLELAGADARGRIELREDPGEAGPRAGDPPPELVFIDGSHDRELTKRAFAVWREALAPGGVVVFHDYGNPVYPGVTEALRDLALEGTVVHDVFVWRSGA